MYEADDITEDTEEIILEKQRFSVENAEFALRRETLDHKRTKELTIPRQGSELTEKRDDAALAFETASKDLPRLGGNEKTRGPEPQGIDQEK